MWTSQVLEQIGDRKRAAVPQNWLKTFQRDHPEGVGRFAVVAWLAGAEEHTTPGALMLLLILKGAHVKLE